VTAFPDGECVADLLTPRILTAMRADHNLHVIQFGLPFELIRRNLPP
jgi:hypothetical protein